MKRHARRERGIALVMVMLACVLLAAALAVMLNVGTSRLRASVEHSRALQALAGADAGAGWLRAQAPTDRQRLARNQRKD